MDHIWKCVPDHNIGIENSVCWVAKVNPFYVHLLLSGVRPLASSNPFDGSNRKTSEGGVEWNDYSFGNNKKKCSEATHFSTFPLRRHELCTANMKMTQENRKSYMTVIIVRELKSFNRVKFVGKKMLKTKLNGRKVRRQ